MTGKIYTKKGDKGETGVIGGGRMSKSDALAEALGTIDELNSWIGLCREKCSVLSAQCSDIEIELKKIQNNLMTINAILAGSPTLNLRTVEVVRLEKLIDKLTGELPKLSNFIYTVGYLQVARSVARRCERQVVSFQLSVSELPRSADHSLFNQRGRNILKYLNRLSDALFVMARWVNKQEGIKEETWCS